MRSLFQTKHINDSMFIKDWERWHQWCQYNITLEGYGYGVKLHFQQYLSYMYIMPVSFIGGGSHTTIIHTITTMIAPVTWEDIRRQQYIIVSHLIIDIIMCKDEMVNLQIIDWLIFGVLMPLSAIFQLYHGDQFKWWKKPEYLERTTDHGQATGKLYQLRLRVEYTLFVIYKAGREPTPY